MIYNRNKSWYKKNSSVIKKQDQDLFTTSFEEFYYDWWDDYDYSDDEYEDYLHFNNYIHAIYNGERKLIGYCDYNGRIICHIL